MSVQPNLQSLTSHTTVRKYTNEKLTREQVVSLVQAAQTAASSNHLQTYSIIWLENDDLRKQIGQISNNVTQYESADAAFVVCVDFARLNLGCKKHDKTICAGTAENLLLGIVDASLFAQNLVAIAELSGYGTCYIGGIRTNIAEINKALGLPDLVFPIFGLTIGKPNQAKQEVKPRLPIDAVLFENTYDAERLPKLIDDYDEVMRVYFKERTATPVDTTWTQRCLGTITNHVRPHMRAFLESKGFKFL